MSVRLRRRRLRLHLRRQSAADRGKLQGQFGPLALSRERPIFPRSSSGDVSNLFVWRVDVHDVPMARCRDWSIFHNHIEHDRPIALNRRFKRRFELIRGLDPNTLDAIRFGKCCEVG